MSCTRFLLGGAANTVQYSIIDTTGRAPHGRRRGGRLADDARFSLTDDYVVIYDLPVTFDGAEMARRRPQMAAGAVRLALQALVGRVRVPDVLTTRMNAETPSGMDAVLLEREVTGPDRGHVAQRRR